MCLIPAFQSSTWRGNINSLLLFFLFNSREGTRRKGGTARSLDKLHPG